MSMFTLSLSERRALATQIQQTKDVKVLKRAQALLWLTEGISVSQSAQRLGVSRQTLYDWVSAYHHRCQQPFLNRLQDEPKPGRPPRKSTVIFRELDALLSSSPRQDGYHHAEWTAPLLTQVFQRNHALHVSTKTMRRCLKRSHYVWKRPGYRLSRQSATRAQAKGGSKEDSTRLQEVSFSSWMKRL